MQDISVAKKNIAPPIVCTAPWRVTKVKALEGFKLDVEFVDGLKGQVCMRDRVFSPKAGVFAKLKDKDFFNQVFVEYGATTWPGELDLAPDAMHDAIEKHGQWILK